MDLYEESSKIITTALNKRGSIKNLVFSSNCQRKKSLYALVCESVKCLDKLQDIGSRCSLLNTEHKLHHDNNLLAVLLYEHILGRGVTGKYKAVIVRHKNAIHAACERMKMKSGVTDIKALFIRELSESRIPKYVRVNSLKTTADVVREKLLHGFTIIQCTAEELLECIMKLDRKTVIIDPHIPDLLVFHSQTDLHSHPLYHTGAIILQDKASCTPAYVLSPTPGSTVIDCCAAPGNKTTQLAAIMNNNGKIYAFDRDRKRLQTLEKMVSKAGASCVTAQCCDFLTVDPADERYTGVEYILVDPSCSGSGIVDRLDTTDDEDTSKRLEQLSAFQMTILKHALSFPNVKRVVYSTCSVHEQENEQVVEEVYSQVHGKFDIEHILPHWPIRGLDSYKHGQRCLRMSPDQTFTNGFFVACFKVKMNDCDNKLEIKDYEIHTSDVKLNNKICVPMKQLQYSNNKTGVSYRKRKLKANILNESLSNGCSSSTQKAQSLKATTNWTVVSNTSNLVKGSNIKKRRT